MTALTLSTAAASGLRADAIVVGVAKGAKGPSSHRVPRPWTRRTTAHSPGSWRPSAIWRRGRGDEAARADRLRRRPSSWPSDWEPSRRRTTRFSAEALRRAAGAAARALAGAKKAVFALPITDAADAGVLREGAALGAYAFDAYKENGKNGKDAKNGKAPLAEVTLLGGKPRDAAYKAALARATAVTEELNRARDLINTPPNDLYPEAFAAVATAAGTASRCRCWTRRPWRRAATAASSASAWARPPLPAW